MNRGDLQATIHRVAKSQIQLSMHTHTHTIINLPPFSPTTVTKTLTLEISNTQHKKIAGREGGKSLLHRSLSPQINSISFHLVLSYTIILSCSRPSTYSTFPKNIHLKIISSVLYSLVYF